MNDATNDGNGTSRGKAAQHILGLSYGKKEDPKAAEELKEDLSAEGPQEAPMTESQTKASEAPHASPVETPKGDPKADEPTKVQPPAGMRLRMKVWTDPTTRKRYLMPTAVLTDPRLGMMTAYAMSDEDTKPVKLTPIEWNALPFFYFQEDGPAPRAAARPVDVIRDRIP